MSLKDDTQFEAEGYALQKELRAAAEMYHFRSDEFTTLSMEADIVVSQLTEALGRESESAILKPDSLEGPSNHPFSAQLHARLKFFYAACAERMKTP